MWCVKTSLDIIAANMIVVRVRYLLNIPISVQLFKLYKVNYKTSTVIARPHSDGDSSSKIDYICLQANCRYPFHIKNFIIKRLWTKTIRVELD